MAGLYPARGEYIFREASNSLDESIPKSRFTLLFMALFGEVGSYERVEAKR